MCEKEWEGGRENRRRNRVERGEWRKEKGEITGNEKTDYGGEK